MAGLRLDILDEERKNPSKDGEANEELSEEDANKGTWPEGRVSYDMGHVE